MIKTIVKDLEKVSPYLRGFALKLTENNTNAQDLFQDTVLRICSNADKFQVGTNFRAWAMAIMKNIFINDYRKRSRRKLILENSNFDYIIHLGRAAIVNEGENNMKYAELLKIIHQLPDIYRLPFWMAYQGYSYPEISASLEIPIGTVKSRIFWARKKIQQLYENANL